MLTHNRDVAAPARTLVIGSTGFVGSNIVSLLEARQWPVQRLSSTDLDLLTEGAGQALADRLHADDALVFVSALTPDRGKDAATLERNVRMGRHVAEALSTQAIAHVVYIGSDAVYEDEANPVRESSCASPSSLHGAMHLAREVMIADACTSAGVPLAVLRPSLLYGPRDTHNGYGPNRYVRTARDERRIALFGEGEERRDHVFIGDLARVVAAILERRSTGVLNVATGSAASFREVADLVAALVGGDVVIDTSERQNPITHRHFANAAIRTAFPAFVWTPLRVGLKQMIEAEA